jgi:hypothetical protein
LVSNGAARAAFAFCDATAEAAEILGISYKALLNKLKLIEEDWATHNKDLSAWTWYKNSTVSATTSRPLAPRISAGDQRDIFNVIRYLGVISTSEFWF